MPTDVIEVRGWKKWPDPTGGDRHVWVIKATRFGWAFTTRNQFAAALCERAMTLKIPARVTWTEGRRRGQKFITNVQVDVKDDPARVS